MPEEATHFGDAVDKRTWTKYGSLLLKSSTFCKPKDIAQSKVCEIGKHKVS